MSKMTIMQKYYKEPKKTCFFMDYDGLFGAKSADFVRVAGKSALFSVDKTQTERKTLFHQMEYDIISLNQPNLNDRQSLTRYEILTR